MKSIKNRLFFVAAGAAMLAAASMTGGVALAVLTFAGAQAIGYGFF